MPATGSSSTIKTFSPMSLFYNIVVRIIAGQLRGRRLKARVGAAVRPISGRIKQSMFDIITGLVPGSCFLDLFSGTGAVGLEALSRGAQFVFFVDIDRRCIDESSENLRRTGLGPRAKAHVGNALSDLS